MASLIDAIRSSLGDQWWFVKLICAVYIVYFTIYTVPQTIPNMQIFIYIIVGLFFLGCGSSTMYRNINNKHPLFPGVSNIFEVLYMTAGGFISIIAGTLLGWGLITLVTKYVVPLINYNNDAIINYIFIALCICLALPFVIIPLVQFSTNKKLTDIKMKDMNELAGEMITSVFSFVIQGIVIYLIGYISLYYFLMQMFGPINLFIQVLNCLVIVVIYFTAMVYFSDAYDSEAIQRKK